MIESNKMQISVYSVVNYTVDIVDTNQIPIQTILCIFVKNEWTT